MLYPDNLYLLILDLAFLLMIFVYEAISMSFSGMKYFRSLNNILDQMIIFMCVLMNVSTYIIEGQNNTEDNNYLKFFQIISLFIVYYRALTFLRIFKPFRHVIDMIIGVTKSTISLLCICAIFVFVVTIMFVKASNENDGY